ncbi:MAG: tetratricopeptide repeat protein [Candidatus Heimdallarchaeaceae archaeon]
MAILGLINHFKALSGTKIITEHEYRIDIRLEGNLKRDFVNDIDFDKVRKLLNSLVKELNGKYLNDIVGRATIENIACYVLFNMKELNPSSVTIYQDNEIYTCIKSIDIDINNYESILFFKRGVSMLVRKKYVQAIKMFDKAILLKPKFVRAYNCRGRCYKFLEKQDLAIKDFSKAIDIDSDFSEAYRNRANCYLYLKKFDLMMDDFNRAVQLDPYSALAFNNRGYGYQQIKMFKEAIQDHTKAIELNPNYAEAYYDRGIAYKALGVENLAENDFKEAQRLSPLQDESEIERSKCYSRNQIKTMEC